jgi:Skp family chaperone for outer membrane proteins
MNTKAIIAALVTAAVSGAVFAQTATPPAGNTNTPVIDKRAANQEKRIEQGQQSGQLTSKEAANLEKRETKLNNDIAKAKSDGTVTAKERAKLTHEENKDSRKIFRKKHNARTQEPAAAPSK